MNKWIGVCDDAIKRFNLDVECCDTCHDDDNGEDYTYIELDNGDYYWACCTIKDAYRKLCETKNV